MIESTLLIASVQLLFLVGAQPPNGSFFWSNRQMECTSYGVNQTRCVLHHPKLGNDQNPECFDDVDQDGKVNRVYCALGCEEALEATMVKKEPSNSRNCVQYYSYNLERRREDWFLWRNATCIDANIKFHIICGLPTNPRVFYRQNEQLFHYDDADE